MARFTTRAVVSFFIGEDVDGLTEVAFDGSDDELCMSDEEPDDFEGNVRIS